MTIVEPSDESQVEKVTLKLRRMVLEGESEFSPGTKIAEIPLARRLGVSRTPVRLALGILEQEGLLVRSPRRGFTVREITVQEIVDAFDVRGALEGLACRLAVEKGLQVATRIALEECLDHAERLLAKGHITDTDAQDWTSINARFHNEIVAAAGNRPLSSAFTYNNRLPLVSPGALAFSAGDLDSYLRFMRQAHAEHNDIFDALVKGESARAEALAREHAYKSRENLHVLLDRATARRKAPPVPGLKLIVGSARRNPAAIPKNTLHTRRTLS